MITSIFKKSKPINFVVAFFIIALASSVGYFKLQTHALELNSFLKSSLLCTMSFFSMLVLNFISSKNGLTQNNIFEIVLFSLFLLLIPQTTSNIYIILSNIFLLFSIRRIISLKSQLSIKKKLFDAAFWITVGSLFYVWTVLFFILIPMAIWLYTENKLRHWLIPITSILSVLLIAYTISILLDFDLTIHILSGFSVSFDFVNYNSVNFLIALTMLLSFGLWSSFFYIRNINKKKKAVRPAFYIVMLVVIISFILIVLVPEKQGSEFLFIMAPLALIITNYIEIVKEKWFREVFLSVLILVPFILLAL